MADRRTPSRGRPPRAARGPGRGAGRGSGVGSGGSGGAGGRPPGRRPPAGGREGPRFTGRAAILLLVLAVLTVSYASSLRAWLQQREHMDDLRTQIAQTGQEIDRLEREKRRWKDDAYVAQQARERFSYLMPGETGYQVIDENGEPLDSVDSLPEAEKVTVDQPTAWWETTWESVEAAGDPPTAEDLPAGTIQPGAE